MVRPGAVAAIVSGTALFVVGATHATSRVQPSDRACLIAWNSPANQASRLRLLAQRPIVGLSLRAGVVYTDTWTKGTSTTTGGPACLLSIAKRSESRIVTGTWTGSGVARWSFGRVFRGSHHIGPNVRLLADGRVTKIYLRGQ
jgi:hypothetical protein